MKILKKIISWLANPKIWILIPLLIIAIAALILGTVLLIPGGISGYEIAGYILLGICGICTAYFIYGIVRIKDDIKAKILKYAEKHKFLDKLIHDYGFRTITFSIGSFIINLAFAVYNGAIALGLVLSPEYGSSMSIWFWALTAYYLILIILRGSILLYHQKRRKADPQGQPETITCVRDTKVYGICGILLLLLPLCLSFAVLQMVSEDAAFVHSGITIYVYAIYAFYKIIASICNFVKAGKRDEMTVRASRNINLADALVSILALQTAMFREFNADNPEALNPALMNAVTGAVVCALTVAIGVYMLVIATLRIKKLKQEEGLTHNEQSEDNGTQNHL
ncbi:MAG: hypothetical protein K2L12_07270 [Clostridia bacterium]|nr:hypothetical protein [Clostridia bacterium]